MHHMIDLFSYPEMVLLSNVIEVKMEFPKLYENVNFWLWSVHSLVGKGSHNPRVVCVQIVCFVMCLATVLNYVELNIFY